MEAPLNILKAGYYNSASQPNTLMQVPVLFTQADSLKEGKTWLHLTCTAPFYLNMLDCTVEGPRFYRREARLYKVDTLYGKKQRTFLHDFYLSSNGSNAIFFPEFYGQEFIIEIDNRDDAPLTVKQLKAYQPARYIVAYLSRGEQYILQLGNKKAALPSYDLSYFSDSIPAQLPEVRTIGSCTDISIASVTEAPTEDWFRSKGWIWTALLLVIGLLGFISYKMIKDMERKDL